ncbi:arginyltransferase [uncultured Desulfobulbus sp.]|uniref:arginyltransferase n=1 Tax=uncultured Desulfobulbus sp. TaxID=239745 RepID=UPI0029C7F0B9|nr:arginyltransferase [uncultured Desulfobulbus sp.]
MTGQGDGHKENAARGIVGDLERFFIHAPAECPYGLAQRAVYHQGIFGRFDDESMGEFLARGYRRNGNCIYTMRCPGCALCVPIRLRPKQFHPNRNQRRVWKKNQDVAVEIAPLTMSRENLSLLQRFLSTRFPAGSSSAESYYSGFFITSISRCFEVRYRLGEQLLGVAIVDGAPSWMNAVYFFFDPDQGWRSPGTLNILTLNHICQRHKIELLYLGYWIDGHAGMSYKNAFRPHELLLDGVWREQK